MKIKRDYKAGDRVILRGGDGEKFTVVMNTSVGVMLKDAANNILPMPFDCENLIPLK